MLHELKKRIQEETRLPVVAGERCVHALIETASCRSCVDACPRETWMLDEELLGIDPDACDGCGLCAPACPQGAILQPYEPALGAWNEMHLAFCACQHSGVQALSAVTEGLLPCVHALGIRELLRLYRDGFRTLFVCRAACEDCARGRVSQLPSLVNELNHLLASRELPQLAYREVTAPRWLAIAATAHPPNAGPKVNRRAFLRQAAQTAVRGPPVEPSRLLEAEQDVPPARLLPASAPDQMVPYAVRIDALKCNGCDACARLCPHGAIALVEGKDTAVYRIDSESCTGCALCIDVCDQGAVRVIQWARPPQTELHLEARRCPACGASYHTPATRADGLCRICNRTHHYQDLYQVLDST